MYNACKRHPAVRQIAFFGFAVRELWTETPLSLPFSELKSFQNTQIHLLTRLPKLPLIFYLLQCPFGNDPIDSCSCYIVKFAKKKGDTRIMLVVIIGARNTVSSTTEYHLVKG
jgi:hypothetical protein